MSPSLRQYASLSPIAMANDVCGRLMAIRRKTTTIFGGIWNGNDPQPATYYIASTLFLRLLGGIYLIAFLSLWTQVSGLIGDHGILPAKDFLAAAKQYCAQQNPPVSPYWNLPTLAWIGPHDVLLQWLCAVGTLLSLFVVFGVLPMPMLILLWVFYLSLFHVGQVFLSFQWDILLLETGFVSIFMAPFALRSRFLRDPHPPRLALWLLWWLLFRLMFESGAVKLTWNNHQIGPDGAPVANTWESLTALDYHYWTQPLPIWTSWYASKLPAWFQKLSVIGVLGIELVSPLLIFGPRRMRYVACGATMVLMLLIAATGNYNFFNLLTVALALTLLDDRLWPRRLRERILGANRPRLFSLTSWRSLLLVPFAILAVVLGASHVKEAAAPSAQPKPPLEFRLNIAQFALVNSYGLFRQMTETRPEIVIEASANGTDWTPYGFRWKPGDPARRPRLCAPHQPRLDWQMWFEALRLEQIYNVTGTIDPRQMSPWFQSFLMQLLAAEPKVVALLGANPLSDARPTAIRILLYQYRFTDFEQGRRTGNWWRRDLVWSSPGWSRAN